MDTVLNKVMAGDDFTSNVGSILLVCFVSYDNGRASTGTKQCSASWSAGISEAEVHRSSQDWKPLLVGWQEDLPFTLDRDAIQRDGVIWVVVISNDFVWHN